MSPNDPDIRFDWAFALTRIGLTKEAIEQLQQALTLSVQDSDTCWYFMGRNYLRQENEEQARGGV